MRIFVKFAARRLMLRRAVRHFLTRASADFARLNHGIQSIFAKPVYL
jgi:hypothetical protein